MYINSLSEKVLYIAATISILFLILDSGGSKNLQSTSIVFIFMLAIFGVRNNIKQTNLIKYIGMIFFLMVSSLESIASGVELVDIMVWIFPLLAIPIFVMFAKIINLKHNHFIAAGAVFSIIIILLFIGRITGNSVLMQMNEFLTSGASGFFNNKAAFFETEYPVVYFQGTLSLVFIGVLAWAHGKNWIFLFALIGLILAPSRFGVITLSIFALIHYICKMLHQGSKNTKMIILFLAGIFGIIIIASISDSLIEIVGSGFDQVRLGHLYSVINEINKNPSKLLTGYGPGSLFYSSGFEEYTNNIEISQLEFLRKYGIFFFIYAHLFLIEIVSRLVRLRRNAEVYALASHYIVSLSNPVLLSIPFLIYIAYLIKEVDDGKMRI